MKTSYIILPNVLVFQVLTFPTKICPPVESENVHFTHIQFNESYDKDQGPINSCHKHKIRDCYQYNKFLNFTGTTDGTVNFITVYCGV